ncbi:class I SAM-dependent methyltransferase, partial [Bacteroides thetaiotaomicron]
NNLSVKTWTNLIDGMIIRSCDELKSILLQSGFVSIASYKHEKGPLCIVARRRAE